MYKIGLKDEVTSAIADFSPVALRYWNVCLHEIATDPFPRSGQYSERIVPIRGFPWHIYNYWITEETSLSSERIFIAEFLPECAPVYAVDEAGSEVEIFSLRNWI